MRFTNVHVQSLAISWSISENSEKLVAIIISVLICIGLILCVTVIVVILWFGKKFKRNKLIILLNLAKKTGLEKEADYEDIRITYSLDVPDTKLSENIAYGCTPKQTVSADS